MATPTPDIAELAHTLSELIATFKREVETEMRTEEAARRRRLAATESAAKLEAALAVILDDEPAHPVGTEVAAELPLYDEIPMGTIAEMSWAFMTEKGRPVEVAELVSYLHQRGKFKTAGDRHGWYGTVFGTLRRDPRFAKAGKGRFRAVEPTVDAKGSRHWTREPDDEGEVA